MRKFLIVSLLIIVGVTIALSFHQPPMRLMPTPKAFVLAGGDAFAANPDLMENSRIEFFYATNRLPVGPRNNRLYAVVPGRDLHLGVGSVLIGDETKPWDAIYALSTGTSDDTRPWLPLEGLVEMATATEESRIRDLDAESPGMRAWFKLLNAALERSRDKDIIIYVHGANSTVERAAGQAAQLRHFTGQNSIVLLFAWPTAENFLRYPSDMETAFGAAPQLAKLIGLLARHTNARHIDVLSYSSGGTVASGGLALAGQAKGTVPLRLGEIYHAAPDADTRAFVDDLRDYAKIVQRVTVAANMGDTTLRISQTVNRASRAGRPDMAELSPEAAQWLLESTRQHGVELLRVRPENIPDLSERSHTFWYNDPWVSSDVLVTLVFGLSAADRGLTSAKVAIGGADEAVYWTFPKDWARRLPGALELARAKSQAAAAAANAATPEAQP